MSNNNNNNKDNTKKPKQAAAPKRLRSPQPAANHHDHEDQQQHNPKRSRPGPTLQQQQRPPAPAPAPAPSLPPQPQPQTSAPPPPRLYNRYKDRSLVNDSRTAAERDELESRLSALKVEQLRMASLVAFASIGSGAGAAGGAGAGAVMAGCSGTAAATGTGMGMGVVGGAPVSTAAAAESSAAPVSTGPGTGTGLFAGLASPRVVGRGPSSIHPTPTAAGPNFSSSSFRGRGQVPSTSHGRLDDTSAATASPARPPAPPAPAPHPARGVGPAPAPAPTGNVGPTPARNVGPSRKPAHRLAPARAGTDGAHYAGHGGHPQDAEGQYPPPPPPQASQNVGLDAPALPTADQAAGDDDGLGFLTELDNLLPVMACPSTDVAQLPEQQAQQATTPAVTAATTAASLSASSMASGQQVVGVQGNTSTSATTAGAVGRSAPSVQNGRQRSEAPATQPTASTPIVTGPVGLSAFSMASGQQLPTVQDAYAILPTTTATPNLPALPRGDDQQPSQATPPTGPTTTSGAGLYASSMANAQHLSQGHQPTALLPDNSNVSSSQTRASHLQPTFMASYINTVPVSTASAKRQTAHPQPVNPADLTLAPELYGARGPSTAWFAGSDETNDRNIDNDFDINQFIDFGDDSDENTPSSANTNTSTNSANTTNTSPREPHAPNTTALPAAGINPAPTALNITGTIDPATLRENLIAHPAIPLDVTHPAYAASLNPSGAVLDATSLHQRENVVSIPNATPLPATAIPPNPNPAHVESNTARGASAMMNSVNIPNFHPQPGVANPAYAEMNHPQVYPSPSSQVGGNGKAGEIQGFRAPGGVMMFFGYRDVGDAAGRDQL
ncbi:hypothetical protein VTJ04DRAFT_5777 [Mycothermus thermophilus]|uniref:uncharacterized protein n=1 Tax=Humicola insolens TaxID=85995 RepID=UPI003743570D